MSANNANRKKLNRLKVPAQVIYSPKFDTYSCIVYYSLTSLFLVFPAILSLNHAGKENPQIDPVL